MNILDEIEISPYYCTSVKLLDFQPIGDKEGLLISLEEMNQVPFDIKRVYYIYGVQPDITRGHHAHKDLKQVLIAISGSVDINCEYKDKHETYTLSSPSQGLLIEGLVWRTMQNFSSDAVLLVLASQIYNEADYIRKYEDFFALSTAIADKSN